jgi:hypothetical protein
MARRPSRGVRSALAMGGVFLAVSVIAWWMLRKPAGPPPDPLDKLLGPAAPAGTPANR